MARNFPSSLISRVECFFTKTSNISLNLLFRFGKMILQYAPAERVDLAVEDVRPAGPRGRQIEAADAAE